MTRLACIQVTGAVVRSRTESAKTQHRARRLRQISVAYLRLALALANQLLARPYLRSGTSEAGDVDAVIYSMRKWARLALHGNATMLLPFFVPDSSRKPRGLIARAAIFADRSRFWRDFGVAFYGANRPGAKVSQGVLDAFWRLSMQAGTPAAYDCIKAFSETDFRDDLKKVNVPTLVIHGDDDQVVPIAVGGLRSSKMIKGATLTVYEGAPHGLMTTHQQRFNSDLLQFVRQLSLAGATQSR